MKPTTVAVFTEAFPPSFQGGGPARSAEAMVAMAPRETRPVVLAADQDMGDSWPLPVARNSWSVRNGVAVYYATTRSVRMLFRSFRAVRNEQPAVLHFNSFFNPRLTILPVLLWRVGFWGRPIVLIAPRGEFGRAAFERRQAKKRVYMTVFRLLGIHRSTVWHSTAVHETEDILRFWGSDARVVLRENQVLLPEEPTPPGSSSGDVVRFASVGRIVEHKGLAIVLAAINMSSRPMVLDIFGSPEDKQYVARCEELIAQSNLLAEVRFRGTIAADSVRNVLADYDALLMPTAGENFGHVIAEALSSSCPVITTPFTPWTQTLHSGGGVVVPTREPVDWLLALESYAARSPEERGSARLAAARAYRDWIARPTKAHVWSLVLEAVDGKSGPNTLRPS